MDWITAHPIPSIACVVMAVAILIGGFIVKLRLPTSGQDIDPMLQHHPPSLTFADSDISETIETLLGRPGVISMSAKEGQEFHVKTNKLYTEAGQEYSGIGGATIIVIPDDSECR